MAVWRIIPNQAAPSFIALGFMYNSHILIDTLQLGRTISKKKKKIKVTKVSAFNFGIFLAIPWNHWLNLCPHFGRYCCQVSRFERCFYHVVLRSGALLRSENLLHSLQVLWHEINCRLILRWGLYHLSTSSLTEIYSLFSIAKWAVWASRVL